MVAGARLWKMNDPPGTIVRMETPCLLTAARTPAYDVTPLLTVGDNVLGVMLGDGMYNVEGVKGRYTKFIGSFGQPKLIARLQAVLA